MSFHQPLGLSLGDPGKTLRAKPYYSAMKNKHLVLLFLGVLVLGLIARNLPVRYRSFFQTKLLRIEINALTRFAIAVPQHADLVFERVDNRWVAEQGGRTAVVNTEEVQSMLSLLAGTDSFLAVKTGRPDTLGLYPEHYILVSFFEGDKQVEHLEIGAEQMRNGIPVSFIRLPHHAGIYQVPGHLHSAFQRSLDDFRIKTIAGFDPEAIRKIGLFLPDTQPVYWLRNDSLRRWFSSTCPPGISNDSMQTWLALLKKMNGSPFADAFDEVREQELLSCTIYLEMRPGKQLTLRIFHLKPPDTPEDLGPLRAQQISGLPVYVLHSSQNPFNYFAVADTNLIRQLCNGILNHCQ